MSTILERMRLAAARELKQYEQAARIAERTGLDLQHALIAARWWPLVPCNSKRSIDARPKVPSSGVSQNTPAPRPVSERERLADACLELIRNWPRYRGVMRYGHDVSDEPRDANGRWTDAGDGGTSAEPSGPIFDFPEKDWRITDDDGNHVGQFKYSSGWVTRSVQIGDGRNESAAVPISTVLDALNSAKCPASAAAWNDWFIINGKPAHTATEDAPNYSPAHKTTEADCLIPEGELRGGEVDSTQMGGSAPTTPAWSARWSSD